MHLSLSHIAKALKGKISGKQVLAPGPGHSAKDLSMAVMINNAGTGVVVKSFSPADDDLACKDYVEKLLGLPKWEPKKPRQKGNGSSVDDDICIALTGKLPPGTPIPKMVEMTPLTATAAGRKLVATYDYTDITGKLQYQVLRYEPKSFSQRRPDGKGGWITIGVFVGISRVPYRWPELAKEMAAYPDAPIFITEGEKDCINVCALGLSATCIAGGKWTDEIVAIFKGRDIIVLEDNDKPGRKKSADAAQALHGVAATVRIARFTDLPEGKNDVTDWIELDREKQNADALGKRCLQAPLWTPETANEPEIGNLPPLTLDQWAERELPDPDFLLGNWLTTTSRVLLSAPTGIGKTNLGIAIGMRAAAGCEFLHWQGRRPARVLYIDGEMSRRLLKERLAYEEIRLGMRPATFFALSREDFEDFKPLNTPEGQAWLLAFIRKIGGVDLTIFDNVMSLLIGNMAEEEPWKQTMPLVWKLTQMSVGQFWLHHTGHDESRSYGTKTREWLLDSVMHLETCDGDGADVCFVLSFRKARERTPATRTDFQNVTISLIDNEWQYELTEKKRRQGPTSRMALKFLDALTNVLASDQAVPMWSGNRKAAKYEHWQAECIHLGLLDKAKPDSVRALLSKYRAELVAADLIACAGELTWRL